MRRVLAAGWGKDASRWVGKRLTLFREPSIKFGGQPVGGIRISHLEGLRQPVVVPLMVARGKKAVFTVQPLAEHTPAVSSDVLQRIETAATINELQAVYEEAAAQGNPPQELIDALNNRKQRLSGAHSEP